MSISDAFLLESARRTSYVAIRGVMTKGPIPAARGALMNGQSVRPLNLCTRQAMSEHPMMEEIHG